MGDQALEARLRHYLEGLAATRRTVTYGEAAMALALAPPHTIHRVATALEIMMAEDAAAGRPLLAALVTSKVRGDMPAPGFFAKAKKLGLHDGSDHGATAEIFVRMERERLWAAAGSGTSAG
ncbi:hypothetical protein [Oceanibacterium hippocampi]|uniref:Uncharacterized protein n=1 Tax=Oceanibacterium hippocampi TaxID=745714 RepID=A0A1Y5SUM8_9PROT|nr:hypothetical protein [Oceanibacterium hippocampi]SLN48470.1 hypothetical protein OCH7691_02102 [Oceanibacterium hippocampi]